jgi:hypothetical protein
LSWRDAWAESWADWAGWVRRVVVVRTRRRRCIMYYGLIISEVILIEKRALREKIISYFMAVEGFER